MIIEKDEIINKDLFKIYFQFPSLSDTHKKLFKTQNAHENEKLVQEIKNRIIDLNNETKEMSKNENDKSNEIIDDVAEILDLINKIKKDKD